MKCAGRKSVISMAVVFLCLLIGGNIGGLWADVTISTSAIAALWGIFITSTTASGIVITGVNWIFAIGYLMTTVGIPFIVEQIKKIPGIEQKAWIPVTLGLIIWVAAGLISGQIHTWTALMMYVFTGITSGGIASSGRDILVKK
jgi:hypothetical protein